MRHTGEVLKVHIRKGCLSMLKVRSIVLLSVAVSLLGMGCGGSEAETEPTETVEAVVIPECEGTELTFNQTSTNVYAGVGSGGYVILQGVAERAGDSDWMVVEMIAGKGGPMNVGQYYIDESSVEDVRGLDIRYSVGCDAQGSCQKTYRAKYGSVLVRPFGNRQGDQVGTTLDSVHLVEVSVDTDGYQVVEGGETLCANNLRVEGEVPMGQGGPQRIDAYAETSGECVTDGTGRGLGHNVGNLEFETCAGTTVNLHDLYCGAGDRAVWFATSAMWCGPCLYRDPLYYDLAMKNDTMDFYVVLGQDSNGGTDGMAAECTQGFGIERVAGIGAVPPENVLLDPNWNDSDWLMNNYGSRTIPYGRVLNGKNMRYIWTDYANDGSIVLLEQALQEAMGSSTMVGWEQLLANEEAL